MRYASGYRVPDHDDKGCCDRSNFLLINSVGYYEFDEPSGATYRKSGRKDYYLSYNHAGSMKLRFHGKPYEIGPGSIFIYRPFEEQYYGQANSEPMANYWVHFTGYGAHEMLVNAGLSEKTFFSVGTRDEIAGLFERMITEVTDKRTGYELMAASLLLNIVSLITRQLDENSVESTGSSSMKIHESVKYIHKYYDRKITVAELAKMSLLSTNRYTNVFKQVTGMSPQQYIIQFRLQKACELMRHTSLNIRQISALTGFDDQLYFSRLFKKYEGMTPSEYSARLK